MSALILRPELPGEVVLLSMAAINRLDKCIDEAAAMVADEKPMDGVAYTTCNVAYQSVGKLIRELETDRKRIKAPFLEVTRQIDAASKEYQGTLADIESRLGAKIKTYQREENARRQAAIDAARKEAEEAERTAYEQAERARAKAVAELPPDERPSIAEPLRLAPVKVAYVAPLLKSAVREQVEYDLEIEDRDRIPTKIGEIWVQEPIESAIKQLLKIGIPVAGCRLISRELTAPRGR
ncbi:MAG: hypothetical protein H0X45_12420 [Planctomycetes bacterium]|nr:hypothetical protein [Planctomycetota bacterium]